MSGDQLDRGGIAQGMASRTSRASARARGPFHKHSVYLPVHLLAEISAEADRLDRSISWMIQHAWRLAREQIRAARGPLRRG